MDQKDWLIISTLYNEKNITKTARRLFISQPALSYRLKRIEEELDICLLYRGRQGVEFTKEGELVASYAIEMLLRLQTLKEYINNHSNEVWGMLRLGATRTFATYRLPTLLKDFSERYPLVDYAIKTDFHKNLAQSVIKNELHVCVARGDYYWPYEKQIIAKENICVFSNKRIDINKLPEMPYIDGLQDPSLKMLIDNWWKERFNRPPLVVMTVDNTEIAKRMVLNNLGYTISPDMLFDDSQHLFRIDLSDNNNMPIFWKTTLLYQKSALRLSAAKAFIELVLEKY